MVARAGGECVGIYADWKEERQAAHLRGIDPEEEGSLQWDDAFGAVGRGRCRPRLRQPSFILQAIKKLGEEGGWGPQDVVGELAGKRRGSPALEPVGCEILEIGETQRARRLGPESYFDEHRVSRRVHDVPIDDRPKPARDQFISPSSLVLQCLDRSALDAPCEGGLRPARDASGCQGRDCRRAWGWSSGAT